MTPILVYSPEEARRNSFVVDRLRDGLSVDLVTPDYRGDADYVINRSNDCGIAEFYEKRGIRVFNPYEFCKLANNKQACYDFMEANGIEIMPTGYSTPPFVKKPVDGHGGQGVVMCHSVDDYDPNMVCQKPASTLGRDLRIWVLGGEIVTSIMRVSNSDFRSNYCLGGSAILHELTDEELALAKKIITLVNGDYYGIDLIYDGNRPVFNELEDAVGARMVYDLTDIDIIGMYCEYIKQETGRT
ncbi:MAG: RimK family alpha-L-glutamate ligase [Eubacterium sp.]